MLEALEPIWRAFNYQCGKLLAPFLHSNIGCIIQDPAFNFSDEVVYKLGRISAATIDRLLNIVVEMGQMQKAVYRLPLLAEPVPVFVPKGGMKPLLFGSPANAIQKDLHSRTGDAPSMEGPG